MSINKTVVPGMGNNDFKGQTMSTGSNMMGGQPQGGYQGTHFPGMEQAMSAKMGGATEAHKPVMGFLYSVSRTASGEYWPLYMGLNTIGRSTSCSVRLQEATISDNHAEIVIRQMKNPDSVLVSIQDARSTCGTLLNGSSLGFEAQICKNGDIITVGEHYELYFVLIDTKSLGLEPREDFIPVGGSIAPQGQPNPFAPQMPSNPFPPQSPGAMNPGVPQNNFPTQPAMNNNAPAGGRTMIFNPNDKR